MTLPAPSVRVGVVQLRTGVDLDESAANVVAAINQAADQGAAFVLTPEASNIVQRDPEALARSVKPPNEDAVLAALKQTSKERGVWVLAGSLMLRNDAGEVVNRGLLIGPDGVERAHYDKIHLFDVTLPQGETYAESSHVRAGDRAVLAPTPWGPLGMTICYDVRFPQLYRQLAQAGAALLAAPAAFTRHTGRAHWEVLLRARAIETGAFVLAPPQGARHADGRATSRRSMINDPWGGVVAAFDHDDPGVLVADLDLAAIGSARTKLPALSHDRPFTLDRASSDGAGQ